VILEVCRDQRPPAGFLEGLRRLCDADGALLIFDEVVTGFRYGWPALYATLGVTPDLLSLGKGMANGYALSALAGRRDYMERGGLQHPHDRVFLLSTTNGPEQSALAAALRTVRFYQEEDVIGALARNGGAAAAAVTAAAARHGIGDRVSTYGDYASRPFLKLLGPDGAPSMPFRTLFLQEVLRRGIFMPWICPSFRHGASEIDRTAEALDGACEVYARALNAGSVDGLLTGPAVKPVFRRKN